MLVAADLPATPDNTQYYLLFAGGVVAAIASVAVAYITRGRERTSPSPPPPTDAGAGSGNLRERTAVGEHRLDAIEQAHDELEAAHELQDRRLSGVERAQEHVTHFLDRQFPDWR